jgi:hypothetical protein
MPLGSKAELLSKLKTLEDLIQALDQLPAHLVRERLKVILENLRQLKSAVERLSG